MKMVEAAQLALKSLGRPATAREIYGEILKKGLFTFEAKDPVGVLSGALRRSTVDSKTLRGKPLFKSLSRGSYQLLS